MANDLETLSAGEIQPYSEGPMLAPLSQDTWGRTDVDLLREDHHQHQSGPTLFGAAMPAGTTPQAIQSVLGEVAGTYLSDFTKLNYPSALIQSAISFFMENATKPARQVAPRHSFKLPNELSNDWLAVLFSNHLQCLSGTQHQKQQFLNASLVWIDKLNKHLNSQQPGTQPAQGRAPHSAEALLNQLSDSDYNKVIKINEQARARTMQVLAAKYGDYSVQQVIDIGQKYLESLPANGRAHFDQFTTGWVHSLNTVEVIEALYGMAIGANSIGDGADLAKEIASFEAMLKIPAERAKYMRDPVLQARLVELYRRRGS